MKSFRHPFATALLALAFLSIVQLPVRAAEDWMGGFKMPDVKTPSIPKRSVKLTDFGAVGDGKMLCTPAFVKAIDALAAQGGGRVIIPAGVWLTAPITLKSNIELHTEEGALVQFTPDNTFKGQALIFGERLENIAITGKGIFDGAGDAWRPVKRSKMTELQWKALLASGGQVSQAETWTPKGSGGSRPRLMRLVECKRILLEDTTFQNSPFWNLNPLYCEDVTILNISIRNPWYSQNGDGLDIEATRNVIIRGVRLDVGDDALCMKAGNGEAARKLGKATENVLIEDCVVYHAHGGFTIGSETSGGIRNVRVNNCTFIGTDIGLRFKTARGRGNSVENIFISNIRMTDIPTDAISFNMYYGGAGPTDEDHTLTENKPVPVNEGTPQFRNIYMENVTVRGAQRAVQIQGLPEMPIDGIHLRNISITSEEGVLVQDAKNITLNNLEIFNTKGPVMSFVASKDVKVNKLSYTAGTETLFTSFGKHNSGIAISGTDVKAAKKSVDLANGAEASSIKLN